MFAHGVTADGGWTGIAEEISALTASWLWRRAQVAGRSAPVFGRSDEMSDGSLMSSARADCKEQLNMRPQRAAERRCEQ